MEVALGVSCSDAGFGHTRARHQRGRQGQDGNVGTRVGDLPVLDKGTTS